MAKVFLGVGHGGKDPGAVGNGLKEKVLTLAIAKACRDTLKRHGVTVKMSRETDTTEGLAARIKECNAFNPDLAADIHINAGGGDGAEVYHSKKSTDDDKLAKNILDAIVAIGQNSRGLKTRTLTDGRDYYGFIRQIKAPAVLVECAFIDNKKDIKILDTAAEQKAMGVAIAKGILKTLGIAWKAETTKTPASFFPAKGYFKRGDTHKNIGKVADFMCRVFPSYTPEAAKGNYFGPNLEGAVKEFQKRTGLKQNGQIDPPTLAELKGYGFKP